MLSERILPCPSYFHENNQIRIDQINHCVVLIVKEVSAMDYELLKKTVDRIKMPEDMKTRIIAEIRRSCFEEQRKWCNMPKNKSQK